MDASTLGAAIGGVGLFLLGVRLLTEGLKVAAGRMLGRALRRATASRPRALLTGIGLTALVQSSSAVTVATLGFVNAGLLGLREALWVVFGSNVGTSMTGWLVALTGVDLDVEAYALPLIGAGALARALDKRRRIGALGEAAAGLGLFFLGLSILGDAFGTLSQGVDLAGWGGGPLGVAALLLVGVALTVAMQSSSAAIAVTLSAAATGAIDLTGAGAMVIGANLGTTSTALLAVVGATPAARRAAVGHVVFNLLAAAVALALLPGLLGVVELALGRALGHGAGALPALAAFHTVFNLLGVILIWPLAGRLERALAARWVSTEEEKAHPRFLDRSVLAVPDVGVEAIARETGRLGRHAGELLAAAIAPGEGDAPAAASVERLAQAYAALGDSITGFASTLSRQPFSAAVSDALARLLRARRHYDTAVEQARLLVELRAELDEAALPALGLDGPLGDALRAVVSASNVEAKEFSLAESERAFGRLQERYDQRRTAILAPPTEAHDLRAVVAAQRWLAEARRGAKHLVRGAEDLMAAAEDLT